LLYEKEYLTRDEFLDMMSNPEQIDAIVTKYKKAHTKKVAKAEKAKVLPKGKKK